MAPAATRLRSAPGLYVLREALRRQHLRLPQTKGRSVGGSPGTVGGKIVTMNTTQKKRPGWSWWYLLFVVQFVVVLWPPLYNTAQPIWMGVPFFYWSQMLCVIVAAVLTAIVYFATEP